MDKNVFDKDASYQEKDSALEALFAQLPNELQTLWRGKIEEAELDIDEALRTMDRVVRERSYVKDKIYTRLHTIKSKELQEEVRTVARTIETSFGDPDRFLGEGKMGEVYEMPYAEHVCVKYLKNKNMKALHGNDFREEVVYMEEMSGFTVSGVRVPELYFEHSSDMVTCFGMEKIQGQSLNKIISNPEGFPDTSVITDQPMDDVIKRLRNFVEMMHTQKKLVHRDLEPRNIMVDADGKWYVIDFGKSKRIEIGDDSTDLAIGEDLVKVEHSIRTLYHALGKFDNKSKV